MGELRQVGEDITTMGTKEQYKQKKERILSSIDPAKEYAVMGRIYCAYCRAEISLDMPERNFYAKCVCECVEKRQREEERKRARMEKAKRYRALNDRAIPADAKNVTFYNLLNGSEDSEEYITACERCEKFCRNFAGVKESGRGIWLQGESDTGKTYLAVAILNTLQGEGVMCIFTTVEMILQELKAVYNGNRIETEQDVMAKYSSVECLIIDDFRGVKVDRAKAENWSADRFGEIIKRRYDKKRPTVITSRESIREIAISNRLSRDTVEKLVNRQVSIRLSGSRRKAVQTAIEF